MVKKVSFSGSNLKLPDIGVQHKDVEVSLRYYFNQTSPSYNERFKGYKKEEVEKELEKRLSEQEKQTILTILSSVEAAFQVDYYVRCHKKLKDPISRSFYENLKKCNQESTRPSLGKDILPIWKEEIPKQSHKQSIKHLLGAFKYRHWLAHGRYWKPNFGKNYDYNDIYSLAEKVLALPLLSTPE